MIETLPLRERYKIRCALTHKRIETLLPPLMRELGIDFWIVTGGDFHREPVQEFLLDEDPTGNTIVVLSNCGNKFEKLISARFLPYGAGEFYKNYVHTGKDMFEELGVLIREKSPRTIALNFADDFNVLDGISHTSYEKIRAQSGDTPIVSAQELSMRFMQHRLPEELENYEAAAAIARDIIHETFTRKVITPGVTTTDDVRWFMRERMLQRGVTYSWGPNCDLQRRGCDNPMLGGENEVEVILPGDLVHIDFGIGYLQLETDMQYLCYVPLPGETTVPAGLVRGFELCRAYQQIYMDTVRPGRTGNELWREINEKAQAAGMKAMTYSHPIGFHVHGVGASIGRFGQQPDIPCGKFTLQNNMCFAMEQNVRVCIPEWENQEIFIFREEDVALVDGRIRVIGELQPEMYLL